MYHKAKASRLSWPLLLVLCAPFVMASADAPEAAADPEVAADPTPNGETPVPNMKAEDYRLYREYQNALRDPRVQAMPEGQRLGRIARNFSVPLPRLREVVTLGDEIGEGQLERQQAAARAAMEGSALNGRIRSVEFVDSRGIVVAYVGWRTTEQERLIPEAALIAKTVTDAAPIAELVAMWACMGNRKVLTARIQNSAAGRINLDRIDDFAETRYIRLFEEVKNRFAGDPPEDDIGCG